jgi:hypothetical protein
MSKISLSKKDREDLASVLETKANALGIMAFEEKHHRLPIGEELRAAAAETLRSIDSHIRKH